MDIVIFKELTTSDQIQELKLEAEKYTGLYVDMNEPEQRKYVKEKADLINQLLKKVDRKRIDAAKEYKAAVEKEAASIVEDLNIANLPFTLLIDEHKAERKRILDAEKADKEAKELAIQIELDHEMAILMNDKFDSDKIKLEQERIEYEKKIKAEAIKEQAVQAERDRIAAQEREAAAKQALIDAENQRVADAEAAEQRRIADIEAAKQAEIQRQEQEKRRIAAEEQARLSNLEHVKYINNSALKDLIELGLTENNSKAVISAISKNLISNITINY